MKNIVLSAAAVFALSSFAIAGGDITPVEEPAVEVPEVVAPVTDAGFYIGIAYGYLNTTVEDTYKAGGIEITDTLIDDDFGEIMLQAGYKFNQYVAVEGRYWLGVNDGSFLSPDNIGTETEYGVSIDAFGLYVKPMYPVAEGFNVYALLGYASADATIDGYDAEYVTDDIDGFSWGIGAEYAFNENLSVFVDYTVLYDDTTDYNGADYGVLWSGSEDRTLDVIDFGVTYKF